LIVLALWIFNYISFKIHRNEELVALFDWSPGNHLGRCLIGTRQIPMAQLVLPGSAPKLNLHISVFLASK
jgi:hypothetical protein